MSIPSDHWLSNPLSSSAVTAAVSEPIATAPIEPEKPFGPCLLWPGRGGPGWVIGCWDGMDWCDEDSELLEPIAWAPLPAPPRAVAGPPVQEAAGRLFDLLRAITVARLSSDEDGRRFLAVAERIAGSSFNPRRGG